jgi:hypothetical protein
MVRQSMSPGEGRDSASEVKGQKVSWEGNKNSRKTINMAAEASSTFCALHSSNQTLGE